MKTEELRQFSPDELKVRVHQWKNELFRRGFKTQTSEARDTSILGKLRRDIARGLTVLNEMSRKADQPQDKVEIFEPEKDKE